MSRPPRLRLSRPASYRELVAAGVTPAQLRTSAVTHHSRGLYVPAAHDMGTAAARVSVAALVVPPRGAVTGWAAAWLRGWPLHRSADAVEIVVPPGERRRPRPGVVFRESVEATTGVEVVRGLLVAAPDRTVYDALYDLPLPEAVVDLDAWLRDGCIDRGRLRAYLEATRGRRGVRTMRRALCLADARAESPMESRLRVLLIEEGLPPPVPQYALYDDRNRFVARIDLAYPECRLGIEYDGEHHWEASAHVADRQRQRRVQRCDWELLRLTAADVYRNPESVVRDVADALRRRGSGRGSPSMT